ncbi:ATP-dependent DNA ligase [Rhodopseudomonas thermotolerans]|uniref:DNA ligase (ATP) n=2 Tax=Rhodopseudomonas TaxID=1073 RepID=A0A336JI77_9BRAD|nr:MULTISPECIES: ATP-dependent DNA ligase [Rhodopseudomonas]RED38658.1 ATP-dependent DNA ligase [Rhodopseudomonas pentothenatexigens]REG06729.1 ATP-dependent DNA ligase [Rhodopseudomonas thermotolerans]SSW89478.1 ATP-dependent DNA ligase [Rhodopseudomonas pentothenatexigens]
MAARAKSSKTKSAAPIEPMEARSVDAIPTGSEWQYEPKWDGFRCLLVRNGDDVALWSKSGEDLTRYFPELVAAALKLKAERFVLDGEIVVPQERTFSFDDLLQRIHPAASRVKKLATETPAMLIVFDLLAGPRDDRLAAAPLGERREALEAFAEAQFKGHPTFRLSPVTTSDKQAANWLAQAGGGSDGVIAKRRDLAYQSGNRDGMQKIKKFRSADCVVGGFRYGSAPLGGRKVVGSLLLGLYDKAGLLHHVGFTSALKRAEKPALTDKLEELPGEGFTGNAPGGPSRWSTARSAEWQPLAPKLVVEICYDHFSGERFRHGTSLLRWRPDKAPRQCTMDQLEQKQVDPIKLLA